jgi:hypothetical protein
MIRELVRYVQDNDIPDSALTGQHVIEAAIQLADAFDALDDHLTKGGHLPTDWLAFDPSR